MSARDLSGFQSVPPPPPHRRDDRGNAPDHPSETDHESGGAPEERRRITLSLPTGVAARLREAAASGDRYYLDIIGTAFAAHHEEIERAFMDRAPASPLGERPRHRKHPPGRVQVALALPAGGLAELDTRAARVELDRSSYVTELLDRHLD